MENNKVDKRLSVNHENGGNKYGRTTKEIDWAKVDQLLMAGCIGTEIAPHFDMHPTTFYDKMAVHYGMSFTEYCAIKRQQGESLLKAQQYAKAMGLSDKGDNTLLIWLGKCRLGQKETQDVLSEQKEYLNEKFEQILNQLNAESSSNLKIEDSNISNETKS